ncbi:phage tail spike protein [Streptococcus sp. ZJ100]|uniref:phage tail spike protein n=1 Tax=Streptococcus handemini TaxID=3161188 RepID=UPI0032EC460C
MIYLKEGNIPLNLAWDDDIVQEANGTYQLSFKFPVTDEKWSLLTTETFLLADDLHGEQEFFVFDVVKENGYVQVYANQVATLLNYYTISSVHVDRVAGQTVMNALAGAVVRKHPFSFSSDIMGRHTLNVADKSVMDVLAKEKHSILGQWGGDLVRDKYDVSLVQNGGTENESLFMYKKNLSKYHESKSVKSLRTRIHFRKKLTSQEEGGEDQVISVTVESPLIEKYSQIYEATMEVNDQDVTDLASLTEYGKRYFATSLCDLVEESLELEVKGKSDVPVKMFDVVSVYHERFDTDIRIKISKYHFSPMSKKLKSIGFGKVSQSMGSTLSGMVSDAVSESTSALLSDFDVRLQKEIENANRAFDAKFEKLTNEIEDGIEQAKAKAEETKATIAEEIEEKLAEQGKEAKKLLESFQSADLDKLRKQIEETSETARVNAALIGGDGTTSYNKNRLAGETERTIALGTDYVTVGHNGNGFEVGKTYVISWDAVCTPYGNRKLVVVLQATPYIGSGELQLRPTDSRFPVIEQALTQQESSVLSVYYGGYTVRYASDWYQEATTHFTVADDKNKLVLPLRFKGMADGNLANQYEGSWSDKPVMILDGGNG